MNRATKAELRQEIAELRKIGRRMASVCFNLGRGQDVTPEDLEIMGELWQKWDAIKRSEK